MAAEKQHGDNVNRIFNGHSLSSLTGTSVKSQVETRVEIPPKRLADVLEQVGRLGHTGALSINFHAGHAMSMFWREVKRRDD